MFCSGCSDEGKKPGDGEDGDKPGRRPGDGGKELALNEQEAVALIELLQGETESQQPGGHSPGFACKACAALKGLCAKVERLKEHELCVERMPMFCSGCSDEGKKPGDGEDGKKPGRKPGDGGKKPALDEQEADELGELLQFETDFQQKPDPSAGVYCKWCAKLKVYCQKGKQWACARVEDICSGCSDEGKKPGDGEEGKKPGRKPGDGGRKPGEGEGGKEPGRKPGDGGKKPGDGEGGRPGKPGWPRKP